MARTKGATDKKKRKPVTRPSAVRPGVVPGAASRSGDDTRAGMPPAPGRPPLDRTEFHAAIAAELKQPLPTAPQDSQPGQGPPGGTPPPPARAASFDPRTLTLEGLASAWQVPFYVLAVVLHWLHVTPDPQPIIAIGKRRAVELAEPSYLVYDYILREYLGVHPDQQIVAAGGATALNAVGILPEIAEAIRASRRRAVPPEPASPP